MGKNFRDELSQIPETVRWAAGQQIGELQRAINLYSDRGLYAIGSGGSFTAAAFAAELHLRTFGSPSQAVTPLDVYALPVRAHTHVAGLLLSAEGKNHDILTAARQLLVRGCPAIGVTLRERSPLIELCKSTGAAALTSFDMPWGKDGYLATNSLVATLVLLWRAYAGDGRVEVELASVLAWHREFRSSLGARFAKYAAADRALILHGIAGRIGAIDLESKLAESDLAFGQLCNFRQFAHGRHLQLARPNNDLSIVLMARKGDPLASATRMLLPMTEERILEVDLPTASFAGTEIAAVLAALEITAMWAGDAVDPGRPNIPQFGRSLHALDVELLVNEPLPGHPGLVRKDGGLAAAELVRRAEAYLDRFRTSHIGALVCDFDGTFCDTVKRFDGLDPCLVDEIVRLTSQGVRLAFATGRGASLAQDLRERLPSEVWCFITLGCYTGSVIFELDTAVPESSPDLRLERLRMWLIDCGALPATIKARVQAGQLGLRDVGGADKWHLVAAINEWVRANGERGWRTFSSGHSVDVITEKAGKLRVVDYLVAKHQLDPLTEMLRIGDSGDFGGNDRELLSVGLALSVESVAPSPAHCWNVLPRQVRGVRGTLHYLQGLVVQDGTARFSSTFLQRAAMSIQDSLGSPDHPTDHGENIEGRTREEVGRRPHGVERRSRDR